MRPFNRRQRGQRNGHSNHEPDVEVRDLIGYLERPHDRRDAQNAQDVEDVAPDHVAHGNVRVTPLRRDDARRELGQGGPGGYQGQSDDRLGDAEHACDIGRADDEQPRTHHEQRESGCQQPQAGPQ